MSANCSAEQQGILERHERICRQEARVIVSDERLWHQYLHTASQIRADRGSEDTPFGLEAVPGYHERFGNQLTTMRSVDSRDIERSDISIYHGETLVARLVDYVAVYGVFGGEQSLSCVAQFPDLYFREEDAQ